MAAVKLAFNDGVTTLAGMADLAKLATEQNLGLGLRLATGALDGPIAAFAGQQTASFTVDDDVSWTVGGAGEITLGVKAGAKGIFEVRRAGEKVLTWRRGEDEKDVRCVKVPEGQACLTVGFLVTMNVEGGAEFSSGQFGVSAEASHSRSYRIVNHKMFPASTPLRQAATEALNGFVLPFHAEGIAARMAEGDFAEYEFSGKILGGFGATYGVTQLLLAGASKGEIKRTFESELGKAVMKFKPSVQAGVSFAVEYEHSDTFRVVVERPRSEAGPRARLSVFRARQEQVGVEVSAKVKVTAGLNFTLAHKVDELVEGAARQLFAGVRPAAARDLAVAAFKGRVNALDGKKELDKFVKDANKQIKELLAPTTQQAGLTAKIERVHGETALMNYEFDLARDTAREGFALALAGNFVEAIRKEGVELAEGSYVEELFIQRTSLGLQFFDLYRVTTATEYFQKSTLTYAGNGLFRFLYKTGVKKRTEWLTRSRSAEVYFSVDAQTNAEARKFTDLDVRLNFALRDEANPKAARQTAQALRALSPNLREAAAAIEQAIQEDPGATIVVECAFDEACYARIQADDFVNGKPKPLIDQRADRQNYYAFVEAVNRIPDQSFGTVGFPREGDDYAEWALYNVTARGASRSSPPDRTRPGNLSVWPADWPKLSSAVRASIVVYLDAARLFLNFCAALRRLATELDQSATDAQLDELLSTLDAIIKRDVQVHFIKTVMLALFTVSKSAPGRITVSPLEKGRLVVRFEAVAAAGASA